MASEHHPHVRDAPLPGVPETVAIGVGPDDPPDLAFARFDHPDLPGDDSSLVAEYVAANATTEFGVVVLHGHIHRVVPGFRVGVFGILQRRLRGPVAEVPEVGPVARVDVLVAGVLGNFPRYLEP